jgi:hypothetical protein
MRNIPVNWRGFHGEGDLEVDILDNVAFVSPLFRIL